MNTHLAAFDKSETINRTPERKKADVVQLYSTTEKLFGNLPVSTATLALEHFSQDVNGRDNKAIDYLVIGVLSLLIHSAAVDFFKRLPIEKEELVKPVKNPPKVQISFVQPKPKPVVPPPPPVVKQQPPPPPPVVKQQPPPPPPKVVALNKPPKPKIKPKPEPKLVEPLPTPTPVTHTAVEAPVTRTPAPVIAPPAPPPAPKPVEKVTQPSSGADYLNNPAPNYPDVAMDRGWEGKVLMKVHVLANGRPDSVAVTKSSGHDELDDEAVKTVKKWSFVPGKRGDTPVDGWVTVPIAFNLQN
jgi:protein TonB